MPRHDDESNREGVVVAAVQRGAIAEVRRELDSLERRADRTDVRIDKLDEHVDDLRTGHARLEGQVEHLSAAYQRAATVATAQVMTDLEVRKADALAQIKDRGLERKHSRAIRREMAFKAIAIAMGGATLLYSILQSRC